MAVSQYRRTKHLNCSDSGNRLLRNYDEYLKAIASFGSSPEWVIYWFLIYFRQLIPQMLTIDEISCYSTEYVFLLPLPLSGAVTIPPVCVSRISVFLPRDRAFWGSSSHRSPTLVSSDTR